MVAWGPLLGTPWAASVNDVLVASNVAQVVPVKQAQTTTPSLYLPMPKGGVLASNGPASVPLFGRAVFVVCTFVTVPTDASQLYTVFTDRDSMAGSVGQVILRADPGAEGARMVTWVRAADGWFATPYIGPPGVVKPGETRVWGFQYVQNGADLQVTHIPAAAAGSVSLETTKGKTASPPPSARRLQVGAWRAYGAALGDPVAEQGDVALHEIVVFRGAMADADLQAVYQSLVRKWSPK